MRQHGSVRGVPSNRYPYRDRRGKPRTRPRSRLRITAPVPDPTVCIFMTDGITEAFDDALLTSRAVLAATVREESRSATGICDAIMARALEGHGPHGVADWTDDRTVVVVKVRNAQSEQSFERH